MSVALDVVLGVIVTILGTVVWRVMYLHDRIRDLAERVARLEGHEERER